MMLNETYTKNIQPRDPERIRSDIETPCATVYNQGVTPVLYDNAVQASSRPGRAVEYLHSLGSMLLPMVLYPLVLSFMTAMAGTLPFAVSTQWILFALGAAAFCISDLFVARDFICGITGTQKNGALILYYLAVYAMASIQLYL